MNEVNLPNGWMSTALENICEVVAGNPAPQGEVYFENGEFNFVRVQDMGRQGDATYLSETKDKVNERAIPKLRLFPKGSVLFTKSGASTLNNQRAILGKDSYVVSHIAAAIPENGISSEWIYFSLVCVDFADLAHSSVMPSLPLSKVKPIQICVPPTNEQHRIVAKIEELFSELDKGIENLKTARAQLKVYRQALLKHAFEGKLTAQWREENQGKLETADALLKRIQQERAQRYQQQLADWEDAEKQGSKPKVPKPLPPLTAEELAELPELPGGWGWVRIGELVDRVTVGHVGSMKDEYVENGIPFLRSQNVRENRFDPDGLKFVAKNFHDSLKKSELFSGDVVVVRSGSIGVSCVIPETLGVANCSDLVIVKKPRHILPSLLAYYMNWQTQGRVKGKMVGVALIHFNTKSVEDFAIPLIDQNEQEMLQNYIEERFSVIDQLDQTITTSLQQTEALRQSILKKAFSGQLVAQDANDEPASVLLTRIKAERAAQAAMAKPRKPQKVQTQPAPAKTNVIPFPVKLANISTTDLHAGILARAYQHHEHTPKYLAYFGHVKAEKIAHLVEAHLGIDLGREPIKAAAGPNDYPHLKKIESRAQKANWFNVRQKKDGGAYVFTKGRSFDALLFKTQLALGDHAAAVDELMSLLLPLNTRQAEIVATLYAAWNNLLLHGGSPSDEEIVYEARESWHASKLGIEREKFFRGLEWMRRKGLVPAGKGRYVDVKDKLKTTRWPS